MKSNSRDSPEGRPSEKLSTRTAMASVGSGRLKNSDLLKRHGCRTASGRGPSPTFSSAAPRSAQKRLVSGKDMCSLDTEVGSPPALTTSSSSREIASDSLPRSAPYMSTEDGWSTAPVAVTFKLAASSSGPVGAHDCHASMTATACEGGQARWKFVTLGAGTVRKTSDVTTPKLPAPAPRSAQNRSWWWASSHSIGRPSARTICAPARWSEVTPYLLPRIPSPPPSVRPATPTGGQVPAGIARSCSCRASYTSPSRAPAPILARPPETDTERIGATSMTIPRVEEYPAKECPPLRIAFDKP